MVGRNFDKTDPLYYDQFFSMSEEVTDYEAQLQDDNYGEMIALYGHRIDMYLCSTYDPIPVFGEDPRKRYEIDPFVAKGIWDVTPETLQMGNWGKNTEQESIITMSSDNPNYSSFKVDLKDVLEVWKTTLYMHEEIQEPGLSMQKLSKIVMDLQQEIIKLKGK